MEIRWLVCRIVLNVMVDDLFVGAFGVMVCRVVSSGVGGWCVCGSI